MINQRDEHKKSSLPDENILKTILKLGGQVSRFEHLFGTSGGSLYDFKGMILRVAMTCIICTSISGVTLIFLEKNWLNDLIGVFFYVFITAFFVEVSRFIICKLYNTFLKKELSDIAIVTLSAVLAALGGTILIFIINRFGFHSLFMNKPWPVLTLVGFIIGFIIMGMIVLYRRIFGNFEGMLGELQELYLSVLHVLSSALEAKDTYTWGHSDRVSLFATALANELGLSEKDIELVKEAAVFHDIGKIGIPESVLRKEGPLTEKEWSLIRNHPVMSANILTPLKYLREGIPIVRHHHERYDGGGYPNGLSGEEIPMGARIIALADTLDAMTSTRSYRKALSLEEVRTHIENSSGTQFDPQVVSIFLRLWDRKVFQQHIEKSV